MSQRSNDDSSGCLAIGLILGAIISLGLFSDGDSGGGLFFLGVALVCGLLLWRTLAGTSGVGVQNTQSSTNYTGIHKFSADFELTHEIIKDIPCQLLKFKVRGIISPGRVTRLPCIEAIITDDTAESDAQGHRVFTVIDGQQEADSINFRLQSQSPNPFQRDSGSTDWVEIGATPVDALIFPEKGTRKLQINIRVIDRAENVVVTQANVHWFYEAETGYLEADEDETKAQGASLKLGMIMAVADGKADDDEIAVIKNWGEKNVNALPESRKYKRREMLNEALTAATRYIHGGKIKELEDEAVRTLVELGEKRFMWDAYELCMQVLKADGEAHPEEMAELSTLAKRLHLDEAKARGLLDRNLVEIKFTDLGTEGADDQILGVTPDMSKEQIRKHLNGLYKKHQSRSTHDDPKLAATAKEWLDRIAELRKRHLG